MKGKGQTWGTKEKWGAITSARRAESEGYRYSKENRNYGKGKKTGESKKKEPKNALGQGKN